MFSVYCACILKLRMSNRPLLFCTKFSTPNQLCGLACQKWIADYENAAGVELKQGVICETDAGTLTRCKREKTDKNKGKVTLHTFHKRRKSHCRARTSQRHGNGKLGMSCSITGRPVWHRKRDYKTRSSHEQAGRKKRMQAKTGGGFDVIHFFFAILVALKARLRPRRPVHSIPCAVSCFVCCHTVLCERHQRRIWR